MSSALGSANVSDILYNKSLGLSTAYPGDVTSSQLEFGDASPFITVDKLMSQQVPKKVPNWDVTLVAPPHVTSASSNVLCPYLIKYTGVTLEDNSPLKPGVSYMYPDWKTNNILTNINEATPNPLYKKKSAK